MARCGVLIVDDSAFMRRAISLLFETDPEFFVVGIARNGEEAIEKIQRFKPDVVTMDIEMPEMDGIKALEHIMTHHPVPVVMLSVQTSDGTQSTLKALELGAVDFFLKSDLIQDSAGHATVQDFLERVKVAADAKIMNKQEYVAPKIELENKKQGPVALDLLIIGCSTGGPSALQSILPRFPADFPIAIIVIQHMPPGFTKPLADRFNTICKLNVKEAESGDVVTPGTIHIGPAGFQLRCHKSSGGLVTLQIETAEDDKHLYKPSVDVALHSAAPIYGNRLLSVILTGMGIDGLSGCKEVKANGGRIITESENSCVVYGMPKAVYEAGLADKQVPLTSMYQHIISYL